MKRITLLWLAALSLLAASCSNVYIAKSDPVQLVDDVLLLEPVSVIEFLTDEEMAVIDDDLSRENSEMVSEIILSRPGYYHVTDDAILSATATRDMINFYNTLASVKKKIVPAVPVPESIMSVIRDSGKRYALAIVSGGFTRSKRNYTREVVRDVAIAILSLGNYVRVSNKAAFDTAAIIIDFQTEEVVYFRRLDPRTHDPMDKKQVAFTINMLFDRYLWTR